ncbi:MAG: hypothetical protein KF716_19180 [Anaerolineae bacterium]|nr:hypothetical protein [Anaerolineae bacterium]
MIKAIVWWFTKQSDTFVIKDFGVIDEVRAGSERFTSKLALCRRNNMYCLRLTLDRHVARTTTKQRLYLFLQDTYPLERILNNITDKVKYHTAAFPDGAIQFGWAVRNMLKMTAGEFVHGYGRIDHHPRNPTMRRVELFLFRQDEQFWLVFRTHGNDYHVWPITLVDALRAKLAEVRPLLSHAESA